MRSQSLKLFYSYAHEDERYRDELHKHLAMLRDKGVIKEWHDRKLIAGDNLDSEVLNNLQTSNIALFLVSSDFLNSKYCYEIELKKALKLQDEGKVRLIAILIRPVDYEGAPFEKFVMLPPDALPVTKWDNQDEAWAAVAKEIRRVCQEILQELDMQDPHVAKKDEGYPKGDEDTIRLGEKKNYVWPAPQDKPVLFLRARINFSHEAGRTWIMKIIVNGEIIRDQRLLNRPLAEEYKDGRVRPCFSEDNESWHLGYSPNFKANYFHPGYKIVNRDPYIFVFDLSGIQTRDGKYEVIIEHTGQERIEAHKNPIIVREVEIF